MIICISWTNFASNTALLLSIVVALITVPKTILEWRREIARHNKNILKEYLIILPKELIENSDNSIYHPYNMDKISNLINNVRRLKISAGFNGTFTKNRWVRIQLIVGKILESKFFNPKHYEIIQAWLDTTTIDFDYEKKWKEDLFSEYGEDIKLFVNLYGEFYAICMSKIG